MRSRPLRSIVLGLVLAILATPLATEAQPAGKLSRIGVVAGVCSEASLGRCVSPGPS